MLGKMFLLSAAISFVVCSATPDEVPEVASPTATQSAPEFFSFDQETQRISTEISRLWGACQIENARIDTITTTFGELDKLASSGKISIEDHNASRKSILEEIENCKARVVELVASLNLEYENFKQHKQNIANYFAAARELVQSPLG